MTDVQHFALPNGQTVHFQPGSHSYWETYDEKKGTCSGRIPGISTVSKADGDLQKDGLLDWASKLTVEGAAREAALGLSLDTAEDMRSALAWLESGESIWDTLRSEKLTWRDLRAEAGTRGSLAHDILQHLAEGVTPLAQTPWDEATIRFWNEAEPNPVHVESVVYSERLGVAGRFDLMTEEEGRYTLRDLKSSKWLSNSFFVQLNLYRAAAIDCGYPTADKLEIVQVHDNATYSIVDVPIRLDWALNALATYKTGKEIAAEIRAIRKLEKAA